MPPVSTDGNAKVESADSEAWVRATQLPYVVPVDIVMRTLQIALTPGAALYLYSCIRAGRDTSVADWAAAVLLAAFALLLLFRSSGLSIDAQGVHHVSWFVRKRTLPWNAIASVTTGAQTFNFDGEEIQGPLGKVDAWKGPYLMVFTRRDGLPRFVLNFKPYSMRGIKTLAHFLIHEARYATIDESTRKLTRGIVPSILFGEQRGHG